MLPSRTRLFLGFGLLVALGADGGGGGDADGGKPRTDARTVSGPISAVAWSEAKLTIDGADGPVTLKVDRNTAVFLENRLGSARDLAVGVPVRASFGGDKRAVWVEVRSLPSTSAAGRDGGTEATDGGMQGAGTAEGPPVLPPPPGIASAADAGPGAGRAQPPPAADAGTAQPSGNTPAGPSPPEPSAGTVPPRPQRPGPSGPGPMPIGPER